MILLSSQLCHLKINSNLQVEHGTIQRPSCISTCAQEVVACTDHHRHAHSRRLIDARSRLCGGTVHLHVVLRSEGHTDVYIGDFRILSR